jgi:hypothetical protein
MKHKHYDMIVAWAEGKTIQSFSDTYNQWEDVNGAPFWINNFQYRIKPEPKPDVVKYIVTKAISEGICRWDSATCEYANLCLVFDGITGKLKAAEVI